MVMTPALYAMLYLLGSALCWSGFDVTRKQLAAVLSATALVALLTLGQVPLFLIWAGRDLLEVQPLGYLLPGGLGTALNVAANLMFIRAVQISPLSLTIPLLGLTPVFASLLAIPMLGEVPSIQAWLGILLVVGGALWLNRRTDISLLAALRRERGSLLMVGVSLLWALCSALDKLALAHASPAAHGALQCFGVGGVILIWLLLRGQLHELGRVRRVKGTFLLAIAFGVGALGLQFLALEVTFVSLVEALKRAIGVVLAVFAGRIFFGETVGRQKLVSVLLMAIGVAFFAMPG